MNHNSNVLRISLGAGIVAGALTAIYFLIPKVWNSSLISIGYWFGLLAVFLFYGTLFQVARGSKNRYIINVAFPVMMKEYFVFNLLLSVCVLVLFYVGFPLPNWLFLIFHILLAAVFLHRILAMDAAQEQIARMENVPDQTVFWKTLLTEAEGVLSHTPGEFRKNISAVRDAIRYGDPVGHPALAELEWAIEAELNSLKDSVGKKDKDSVEKLSASLLEKIRERGSRAKILKSQTTKE